MDPDLTYNEILFEDGHTRRPQDMIDDDLNRMTDLKQDFIRLMDEAARRCHKKDAEDYYLACEESFDDMLSGAWGDLIEENGEIQTLPLSERRKAWLLAQAEKLRTPVRTIFTNPATLISRGEV